MNQIDMIDIQRRAIQIVDIKRQPRRIKNNYRGRNAYGNASEESQGLAGHNDNGRLDGIV